MATQKPSLVHVYARNVDHRLFMRGWLAPDLARALGVTITTVNRLRLGRARFIDPEVFTQLLELFECAPNDLLLPQPGIDYATPYERQPQRPR